MGDVVDTADSCSPANTSTGGLAKPRREKRDLTRALQLYAGLSMRNAHSALADADATLRILIGQLERWPANNLVSGDLWDRWANMMPM